MSVRLTRPTTASPLNAHVLVLFLSPMLFLTADHMAQMARSSANVLVVTYQDQSTYFTTPETFQVCTL